MTRERAKELAPIIAAYGEGKRVQAYDFMNNIWVDASNPAWIVAVTYRIAPEPRRRLMTRDEVLNFLAEHPNVLVRYEGSEFNLSSLFALNIEIGIRKAIESYSYCLVENGVRSEPRKFEIEEKPTQDDYIDWANVHAHKEYVAIMPTGRIISFPDMPINTKLFR